MSVSKPQRMLLSEDNLAAVAEWTGGRVEGQTVVDIKGSAAGLIYMTARVGQWVHQREGDGYFYIRDKEEPSPHSGRVAELEASKAYLLERISRLEEQLETLRGIAAEWLIAEHFATGRPGMSKEEALVLIDAEVANSNPAKRPPTPDTAEFWGGTFGGTAPSPATDEDRLIEALDDLDKSPPSDSFPAKERES